jgi:hypothetical protein
MKRILATIAPTAALAAALIAIPRPAAAADCGMLKGGTLKTKGRVSSCGKARSIIRDFLKTRNRSIQGYTCSGSSRRVECKLDRKLIIWQRS